MLLWDFRNILTLQLNKPQIRICVGNIIGGSLVRAVPIKCCTVVSATWIFASLQRRWADRSNPLASSTSALGTALANHYGKAQPSSGRCQTFTWHSTEIQGGYGWSCRICLYESHCSLSPRWVIVVDSRFISFVNLWILQFLFSLAFILSLVSLFKGILKSDKLLNYRYLFKTVFE